MKRRNLSLYYTPIRSVMGVRTRGPVVLKLDRTAQPQLTSLKHSRAERYAKLPIDCLI
ncbi:hypothetical protein AMC87_PD00933 (plasmid) [Rhizobium phaseoli]|nr:hypothetical protein AMC87_PD00933 [Rhizobium phaseoli]